MEASGSAICSCRRVIGHSDGDNLAVTRAEWNLAARCQQIEGTEYVGRGMSVCEYGSLCI